MNPTDLAVDAFACHRLTRLVTADTITRPVRAGIIRWAYARRQSNPAWVKRGDGEVTEPYWRGAATEAEWDQMPHDDDDAPKLAAFIVCAWCTSLWISVGICGLRRYAPSLWGPVARALAISSAAALLAGHEDS